MPVDAAWILAAMLKLEPRAPWKNTFAASAQVIADVANAHPLFAGEDGAHRTASVLLALGEMEGSLKPDAIGDCPEKDDKGMCIPGSVPHSMCMYQINDTNFAMLGVTKDLLLSDFRVCAESAMKIITMSFKTCGAKTADHRLDFYASGNAECAPPPKDEGKHRLALAQRIFRDNPIAKPSP